MVSVEATVLIITNVTIVSVHGATIQRPGITPVFGDTIVVNSAKLTQIVLHSGAAACVSDKGASTTNAGIVSPHTTVSPA